MKNQKLDDNLINLKGVGPKMISLFNKLGLNTVSDLIHYFPRDYKEYKAPIKFNDLSENYFVTVEGHFVTRPFVKHTSKMDIVTARFQIDGGLIDLIWYRTSYIASIIDVKKKYLIYGRVKFKNNRFIIEQGELYTPDEYETKLKGLTPIYSTTQGLSSNFIAKHVRMICDNYEVENIDNISDYSKLASSNNIDLPRNNVYDILHFPVDKNEFLKARNVIVFKEFLDMIISLKINSNDARESNPLEEYLNQGFVDNIKDKIINNLDYKLTGDQLAAVNEITQMLESPYSSECMIQGDVGCGKTIIAFIAMLVVSNLGFQSVLMAPTEVLARQHYDNLNNLILKLNLPFQTVLLVGSMDNATLKHNRELISSGEATLIIGTHALIQDKVDYHNVGLVITDEQHKFGVRQREKLQNKGNSPHYIVMSATPIPRSLALILYGNVKILTIKQMPSNRIPIKNALMDANERIKIYRFVYKQIQEGRQAYFVCPLINSDTTRNGENVIDYTNKLKDLFKDTARIEMLHGGMDASVKERIMQDFKNHQIDILVSTTVIEVGVDVPNATVMVIENADTFGLASLHQLRGRIGRGSYQSYCIFVSGEGGTDNNRLRIISSTNDGFEIAEKDLASRGPGEIKGTRQAGKLKFLYGDIYQDSEILKLSSNIATEILSKDPNLSSPEYEFLRSNISDLNMGF